VILGGIAQCLVPFLIFRKIDPKGGNFQHLREISEILKLFWPGLLGAAIAQINLLISRNLAYIYCASAVSILYLANRLTELPLGVFGSAISTVVFPNMSKLSTNGNSQHELNLSFNHGIFNLLWILIPSAIGLYAVGGELLSVFFEWGVFTSADTDKTIPILAIYCVSIPFFGISNFLIRSFHAVKDTKTPAKVGAHILAINFFLTITLARPFGIQGIASATTLSTIMQTFMLYYKLNERNHEFHLNIDKSKLVKIALGALLMYVCVKFGQSINAVRYEEYRRQAIHTIVLCVPFAATIYILVSKLSFKVLQKKWDMFFRR
jgi:putative peptidoglycan lipid II flippase